MKNFQHYSEKGKEENIALPEKKFRPNLKEISGQPETFFRDIYRYIKKSNRSRSTEGELVENKKMKMKNKIFKMLMILKMIYRLQSKIAIKTLNH
ncbi:hypothetical protein OTUT144_2030 [Orientia tsutsugamushi str. UT144]|uniref:Uncharacterized protein n=1 Tax=Orientia tsutsugamushi str. UT144 TaxID=1441384 RepID=A0A0F3RIU5_ORITS|nr:hypothetical protein OTUT144_2030 [Orientia tsutsugamushi str. UT144]